MATTNSTALIPEMPIDQEHTGNISTSAMASSSGNSQASPRNTSAISAGTFVQLGSVEVSKSLQDGEKFVKWDEVSCFYNFLKANSSIAFTYL